MKLKDAMMMIMNNWEQKSLVYNKGSMKAKGFSFTNGLQWIII